MIEFKKNKIAIATLTLARTKLERDIIFKTQAALSQLGYPLVIADHFNSPFSLVKKLKQLDNVSVIAGVDFNSRVRKSFLKAAQLADCILWLESDKLEFAKLYVQDFINYWLKNPAGILVPARTKASFSKYPKYQQKMEKFLWYSAAQLLNTRVVDLTYGPMIFPSMLVKYLLKSQSPIDFGYHYSFLTAVNCRLGQPLKAISYKITPPQDVQKDDELILFRMQQVKNWICGLKDGWEAKL